MVLDDKPIDTVRAILMIAHMRAQAEVLTDILEDPKFPKRVRDKARKALRTSIDAANFCEQVFLK